MRYTLRRPGLWPTLGALLVVIAGLALCNWQLERAKVKAELAKRMESAASGGTVPLPATEINTDDYIWRRIEVAGEFLPKHTVLVDNKVHRGVAGYHVITPLRIGEGERYVLVNRGWLAAGGARGAPPVPATPAGVVRVIGTAIVPPAHHFELSSKIAEGNVWQNLTLERYRAATGLTLLPMMVQQENDLSDGLTRAWSAPDPGVDKHYAYAAQWFGLALVALIFFVAAHVRKKV